MLRSLLQHDCNMGKCLVAGGGAINVLNAWSADRPKPIYPLGSRTCETISANVRQCEMMVQRSMIPAFWRQVRKG
jgi:hypothetical protein